jgi:serine/threonine protein kinase
MLGFTLSGRYKIVKHLGGGGFGQTYLAQVLYQLGNHNQISRLLAHFEQEQEFYLVQEFIEGHDLRFGDRLN